MSTRNLIGLMLVILGVGYLVSETLGQPFGPIWSHWWPVLLVLIGLNQLFRHPDRPWGAIAFTVFSIVLLAWTLQFLPENFWKYIGAILLVLFGIWILLPRRERVTTSGTTATVKAGDRIDEAVIFGAVHLRSESPQFRGGAVSTTAGAVEIDLRNAQLAGEGAVLDLSVFAGAITVKVPVSWPIIMSGAPLLSGCQNRTSNPTIAVSGLPVLRIRCAGLLGGIEVRN